MTKKQHRIITFSLARIVIFTYLAVFLLYADKPEFNRYVRYGDFGLCLQLVWVFTGKSFIKK